MRNLSVTSPALTHHIITGQNAKHLLLENVMKNRRLTSTHRRQSLASSLILHRLKMLGLKSKGSFEGVRCLIIGDKRENRKVYRKKQRNPGPIIQPIIPFLRRRRTTTKCFGSTLPMTACIPHCQRPLPISCRRRSQLSNLSTPFLLKLSRTC